MLLVRVRLVCRRASVMCKQVGIKIGLAKYGAITHAREGDIASGHEAFQLARLALEIGAGFRFVVGGHLTPPASHQPDAPPHRALAGPSRSAILGAQSHSARCRVRSGQSQRD